MSPRTHQFLTCGLLLGTSLLAVPCVGKPAAAASSTSGTSNASEERDSTSKGDSPNPPSAGQVEVKSVPLVGGAPAQNPATQPESPHGGMHAGTPGALPEDVIEPSLSVPARVIEVMTVDPQNHPLPNVRILLVRDRQSIAEGNSSSVSEATSDNEGKLQFTNVPVGSDLQYRLMAQAGEARYGTRPFAVDSKSGMRAVFHVYPLVKNLREALVAGRAFVFVEPRDEVLHVEVFSEWHNLGASVWLPQNVDLRLPAGWKAFSTNPGDPDLRVEKTDFGVRMSGTVTPGQHSTSFSFQLPSNNLAEVSAEIPLWPNTAEAQVATVSRALLELEVEGYPSAQVMQSNGQKPMLVTGRSYAKDTGGPPSDLRFTLRGLPVVSSGRWVAAIIAGLLIAVGLAFTWRHRAPSKKPSSKASEPGSSTNSPDGGGTGLEAEREAQERLMEELVSLTRAHQKGLIGDETFEQARQALLAACVRLERQLVSD